MARLSTKLKLAALAVLLGAWAGQASADEATRPLGVVELFTSQGCNSCPPADKVLGDLIRKGDVVALAYHVDYWDYLGWKDTLGNHDNTVRQYDYAKSFGAGQVYTPQAVINGRTHVNGARRDHIDGTLAELKAAGDGLTVDVSVKDAGDTVVVQTGAAAGAPAEAHVVFVYFDPVRKVEIRRGENNGRAITYWNAVKAVRTAGMWHGKAARFEMPKSEIGKQGAGGCAVLLQAVGQNGLPGPILGAALLETPAG